MVLPQLFNGTLREHYLLLFGMAGGIAAVVAFVAAWFGAQFGAKRAARLAADEALARGGLGVDRTLTALVQAVDAVSLEVERLSEGQRFAARLLSERQPVIPTPKQESSGRVVTPH
jgi:hypothetical protein